VKKNVLALSVASALSFVAAEQARAAGFALYEQGISGMGNAYAGAAAVAEDATTVWWNPAGMARLPKGMHVAVGGAAIAPSWKFSNNGSTIATASNPTKTGTGGDAGDVTFVPSAFFAMDLNPKWNFGVGVSVPFGLKTEYDADWIGRFQGIKSEVQTVNVNPAVSYKFSDAVSVGFGVNYQQGKIDILTGVNLAPLAGVPGLEAQRRRLGIQRRRAVQRGPRHTRWRSLPLLAQLQARREHGILRRATRPIVRESVTAERQHQVRPQDARQPRCQRGASHERQARAARRYHVVAME
jgi:hypothetical protein